MDHYNNLRARTIEDLTLLRSLTEIPEVPRQHVSEHDEDDELISFVREKQISQDLAFIACYRDHSSEVVAVGLEPDNSGNSVIVRVASNAGDLQRIVQNLREIADIMHDAVPRDKSRVEVRKLLFDKIVALDEDRILCRLRSKHAPQSRKTKDHPALASLLLRTVQECKAAAKTPLQKRMAAEVVVDCSQLGQSFHVLETTDRSKNLSGFLDLLKIIVKLAADLDVQKLASVLKDFTRGDPTIRRYLPEALKKIGHYYEVAYNLGAVARSSSCSLFKSIRIEAVQPNPLPLETPSHRVANFDEAFSRVSEQHTAQAVIVKNSSRFAQARRTYKSRVRQCQTARKVHAEVQILLFYDQNPTLRRPRIIGTSKSACYLCNLFFQHHGQYHLSATHGRLYDTWTLPDWSLDRHLMFTTLVPVLEQVNQTLEEKIIELLHLETTRKLSHPNESIVNIHAPWSSCSTIRPPETTADALSVSPILEHGPSDDNEISRISALEQSVSSESDEGIDLQNDSLSDTSSSSSQEYEVSSHQSIYKRIQSGDETRRFFSKNMNIEISTSYDGKKRRDSVIEQENAIWVTVDLVRSDVNESKPQDALTVDVKTLQPGEDTTLSVGAFGTENRLLLQAGNEGVLMTFRSAVNV